MMLWIGLGFLIGMFARTLGRALVLTGVAVGLTLLTLNVGFYLGVDFLVIGGPEPATWDWETMGLIFATDLPLALLAAGATFGVRILAPRLEWTVPSPYALGLGKELVVEHLGLWNTLEERVAEVQGIGPYFEPKHRLLGHPQLIQGQVWIRVHDCCSRLIPTASSSTRVSHEPG